MLPPELSLLVTRTAADPLTWARHVRFDPRQRHWARLPAPPDVDLWVLTWLRDQTTELHDHGDSAAVVVVLQGELREVRVDRLGTTTVRTLTVGKNYSVPVGDRHDITQVKGVPAVSVHGYSPPLTSMTYWRQTGAGLVPDRTVVSDAEELVRG